MQNKYLEQEKGVTL